MATGKGGKVKVEIFMSGKAMEILDVISPVLESPLCAGYKISNTEDEAEEQTRKMFSLNDEVLYEDGIVQWTGKVIFKQGDKYGISVYGEPVPVVVGPDHLSLWK